MMVVHQEGQEVEVAEDGVGSEMVLPILMDIVTGVYT